MKRFACLLFVVAAPLSTFAATKTVAATGADFTTIQAAIDFFRTADPDPGTADFINITDSGVYDEAINVNAPVTIQGTGATRPVIAAKPATTQATGDTGGTDGIVIEMTGAGPFDVTLRNLLIVPSLTSTPADDLVRSVGANLNILCDNVVIAPNNGSNQPVTTTGLTEVDLTAAGIKRIGDDALFLAGTTGTSVTLQRCVITHANNGTPGAGNDGLVCSGAVNYNILDGNVFSFNNRVGIQMAGFFKMNGTTTRSLVLGNKGFAGIWGASTTGGSVRQLNGVNIIGNGLPYVAGAVVGGWGIEVQNGDGVTPATISNAIIAGNGGPGIRFGEVGTNGGLIVTNVTSANNGQAAGSTDQEPLLVATGAPASAGNVTITNSIMAGNGGSNATNKIVHNGTGTVTMSGSALVLAGPLALASPGFSGPGTVNIGSSITQDPAFLQTSNQALSTYFDVQQNAYGTANATSGPLGGGADFVGGVTGPTAAADWNLFE